MNGVSSGGRLAAAAIGVLGVGVLLSATAPTATAGPSSDDYGYVDSTARCAAPNEAIAFGATASSRVAVCKDDSSGQYQYRGVRLSDGARLILAAKATGGGVFVAENDGITYTVTSSALVVSSGGQTIRTEQMVDFHGQKSTATSSAPATTSSAPQAAPTPSTPQPSATPETVAPTTPLPPPLPAEVGHG